MYYSCKRGSVEGFNFNFGGMTITSALAYMIFNVGLFWIPQVQVTHAWSFISTAHAAMFLFLHSGAILKETSWRSDTSAIE